MEPNWNLAANGILVLTGACLVLELCQGHAAGTILVRTGVFMAAFSLGMGLLLVAVKILGRDKPAAGKPETAEPRTGARQGLEKTGGKAR